MTMDANSTMRVVLHAAASDLAELEVRLMGSLLGIFATRWAHVDRSADAHIRAPTGRFVGLRALLD